MGDNEMRSFNKMLLIGLMGVAVTSCINNQVPFSQKAWNAWDATYYNRKFVIDDLLKNHLNKGMSYQDVIDLLGKPCSTNLDMYTVTDFTKPDRHYQDSTIYVDYEIEEIYKWDIDPVAGSYLKIVFGKDSLVTDYKVITWEKGKL